jgi:hypothetical protein
MKAYFYLLIFFAFFFSLSFASAINCGSCNLVDNCIGVSESSCDKSCRYVDGYYQPCYYTSGCAGLGVCSMPDNCNANIPCSFESFAPPVTNITNCMVISQPGSYAMTGPFTNKAVSTCIDINANNVVFDCKGYNIDGTGSGKGIDITGASNSYYQNITLKNCNLTDWMYGQYLYYGGNILSYNNSFNNNNYPIYTYFVNNLTFDSNRVLRTLTYTMLQSMSNSTFKNNYVDSSPASYGFINYGQSGSGGNIGNKFINNTIVNEAYGFYDFYANNTIYKDNILNVTSYALYIAGYSNNLSFYNNKIVSSSTVLINNPSITSIYFNTTLNNNPNIMGGANIGGNYWGTPSKTGYSDKCADANADGICDVAYRIGTSSWYDYLPISNVTITFSQTVLTPTNGSVTGNNTQIVVNVRANVGWKNTTISYKNSTMGDWINMTDCENQSINGNVNINYRCVWDNSLLNSGGEGYDIKIFSEDLSNNNITLYQHYTIDLTLPDTTIYSDIPEYPYSRFNPQVNNPFTINNRLIKITKNNPDIISYFNFDTDTTKAEDKFGNNNGTLTNGATINSNGWIGKGLGLNGVAQYVDIGNASDLNLINNFTLSAWIKSNSTGFIIAKDPTTGYVYRDVRGAKQSCNNGWSYHMGYQFNTTQGGQITELCGIWNGNKSIKIQNSSYAVIYSDYLNVTNTTNTDIWTCKTITPLTLTAGQIYYIGVTVAGSGGCYDSVPSYPRLSNGVNILKTAYQNGVTQYSSGVTLTTGLMYGLVDFKINYGKGSDLPYSLSTNEFKINNTAITTTGTTDNNWHLMTATANGTDMNLYVDGSLVNSTAYSGEVPVNSLPVWIGRNYNPADTTGYFNGTIDEVIIFNRSLSASEVATLYANGTTRFLTEENFVYNQNISTGANQLSVVTSFYNYMNSWVSLIVGYFDGSWTYSDAQVITSGVQSIFAITTGTTNVSLNYTLNGTGFYTPEIYGNINGIGSSTSSQRQTSVRNGQNVVVRINASDSESGIDTILVDLINVNGTRNMSMILQSGSKSAGEWSYFNLSITNINCTDGDSFIPIYVNNTVGLLKSSETFSLFCDNTPTNITEISTQTNIRKGDNATISWSVLDTSPLSPNGYYILSNNVSGTWNNDSQGYLNEDGNGQVEFNDMQIGGYSYQLFTFDDAGNPTNSSLINFEVTDVDPVAVINTYPNSGVTLTNKTLGLGFEYVNTNMDNCSLYVNEQLIQNRNDTTDHNVQYFFNDTDYSQGLNLWYVKCLQGSNEYVSDSSNFTIQTHSFNLTLITPLTDLSIEQNNTFNFTINVTCLENDCSEINATLNYDANNFTLDSAYTQNFTLLVNQTQAITWIVNATGNKFNGYIFNASIAYPTAIDYINITNNILVNITIDDSYPQFSNYWDNNATLIGSGIGLFNVTIENTNGTVWLQINGVNETATNISNVYSATHTFTTNGTYSYKWYAYGNGSSNLLNNSATIDYYVNASAPSNNYLNINFTSPTPQNGTSTTNTSFIANVSIDTNDLTSLIWNFNNTNYTIYNDSLVLMYNFDNVSAIGDNETNIVDVSKYGNNGTISGATWNSSGVYSGAYQTDGASTYIYNSNVANLPTGSDARTISLWVKPYTDGGSAYHPVAGWGSSTGTRNVFVLYQDNTNKWRLVTYADDSAFGDNINPNSWYYLTLTYNAGSNIVSTYINGSFISNITLSGALATSNNYFSIGKSPYEATYFNGLIDEVRIWNRSLNVDEINQMYMTNLNKFNSTQWYLYVNQSKNATAGLDLGTYTYQAFATDVAGNANQTEQRSIIIASASDTTSPTVNLLSPANNSIWTSSNIVNFTFNASDNINVSYCNLTASISNSSAVDDNYTKLLLHMDGTNGNTSFIDTSGKTITTNGDAKISTAQGKFNNASGLFDGTGDYLSGDLGSDTFEIADFTIDYWVYYSSLYDYITVFSTPRSATGFNIGTQSAGQLVFYRSGGGEILRGSGTNFVTNTWYHVAFVRSSSTLKGYVNGLEVASNTDTTNYSQSTFSVGSLDNSGEYLTGYIDEFRISKGIARWTSNFSVPTSPHYNVTYYTNSSSNITNSFNNSLSLNLSNGDYNWNVNCTDTSSNSGISEMFNLSVNVQGADTIYPIFSAYYDNNATLIENGTGLFNVTIENTNGTVLLNINGSSYLATNLTSNVYNVSVFLTNGTYLYNWTSYGNGSSNNLNWSDNRYYTINNSLTDSIYPSFNNFNFNITNGSSFSNGQIYSTNVTIINTNGTAGIEFNGINYTAVNISSLFSSTLGELGVGSYPYYWWAFGNGTSNLYNISQVQYYDVNINNTYVLNVSVSPSNSVTFGTQTTATGTGCPDNVCNLYLDGSIKGNPNTLTLGVGTYNYSYTHPLTQNYSAQSSSIILTVNQNNSIVYTYINNSRSNLTISKGTSVWLNGSRQQGEGNINLYNNNSLINSGTNIGNYTLFSNVGLYNISSIYLNTQNYSQSSETWWLNVICSANMTNTTKTGWSNLTCASTQMNQSRTWVEYDSENCGFVNVTYTEYQLVGPTWLNTTFGSWNNISCLPANIMNQSQNATQFDIFGCGSNLTIFNYRETEYCQYDTVSPYFITIPSSQMLTYGTSWNGSYFVANDTIGFDSYSINNTNNFNINSSGFLNWTGQLAVGDYYINITINDTSNNINSTIYNLNITKAASVNNFTFIGTSCGSPYCVDWGTPLNFSCNNNYNFPVNITVWDGITLIDITSYNGIFTTLSVGEYEVTCNSTGNANITGAITSYMYNVNQLTSTVTMLLNGIEGDADLTYPQQPNVSIWNNANNTPVNLSRNGVDISSLIGVSQDLPAGQYNYTMQVYGNVNYTSYVYPYNFTATISKATGNINLLLNNTANNISFTVGGSVNASASSTTGDISLYRDGIDITSENNIFNSTLSAGYYNYTAISVLSQNYTSETITRFLNITSIACSQNLTNTTISNWINISCLPTNYYNQSRNYTTYDSNNCGFINVTTVEYRDNVESCGSGNFTLLLNGFASNIFITYPTQVNCSFTNSTNVILFRDGVNITSLNNIFQNLGAGYYNFTLLGGNITRFANITKNTSIVNGYVNQIRNNYTNNQTTIELNGSLVGRNDLIQMYLNDTLINNGTSPLYNQTVLSTYTFINFTVRYLGNANYTSAEETWWINITNGTIVDITPPVFTNMINFSQLVNLAFSYNFTATDLNGISCFKLNDTTNFNINCTGYMTNITSLENVTRYNLNLSVNDTFNNVASQVFYIEVVSVSAPTGGSGRPVTNITNNITIIQPKKQLIYLKDILLLGVGIWVLFFLLDRKRKKDEKKKRELSYSKIS